MNNRNRLLKDLKSALACLLVFSICAGTTPFVAGIETLVTYNGPIGISQATDVAVSVNNTTLFVYNAVVNNNEAICDQTTTTTTPMAYFDFTGTVQIAVTTQFALNDVEILPRSYGINPSVNGNTISFSISSPKNITIMFNGSIARALHLFANAIEVNPPQPNNPQVIYYGAGVHNVGEIILGSNQTLYIAGGAYVYGYVNLANATNSSIMGRGIIDGRDYDLLNSPPNPKDAIGIRNCSDISVSGVVLHNSGGWNVATRYSSDVTVDNVKCVGGRASTDGIITLSSSYVIISNCFVRNYDDGIMVKAKEEPNQIANTSNVSVTACVVWTGFGDSLGSTWETNCDTISDVSFINCDVIRNMNTSKPSNFYRNAAISIHESDNAEINNFLFENIRIDQANILFAFNIEENMWSSVNERGHINGVTLKNINYTGTGNPISQIYGYDSSHLIENISIEEFKIRNENINSLSNGNIYLNNYTKNISFSGAVFDRCDAVMDWGSSNTLASDTVNKKEGAATIQSLGSGTVQFQKAFSAPVNALVNESGGFLEFWYYVSDVTMLGSNNQVEISSSGTCDQNEYGWVLSPSTLVNGWNFVKLKISDSMKSGSPDLSAINWFRIYNVVTGSLTTKLDYIKFTSENGNQLDVCDVLSDFNSSNTLSIDTNVKKDGIASIQGFGSGVVQFQKAYSAPVNTLVNENNGFLEFWYYVSDTAKLGSNNQIEISSSGTYDQHEYEWILSPSSLVNGWNFVKLKISEAMKTGSPDLSAINWFRIYNTDSDVITTKIDDIKFSSREGNQLELCDLLTGFTSSNTLSVDTTDKKDGIASIQGEGDGVEHFSKILANPVNTYVSESTGYLQFWYYVSDVTKLSSNNQVEISSSGTFDNDEYSWVLASENLNNGWNLIKLKISDAFKIDMPDLEAINWFRVYNDVSGSVVTKIDDIRFVVLMDDANYIENLSTFNLVTNMKPNTKVLHLKNEMLQIGVASDFKNVANIELANEDLVGTGTTFQIDSAGYISEYVVISRGDIDGDGEITTADLVAVKQRLIKIITQVGLLKNAEDMNIDGKISISDLLAIKYNLLGITV